MDVKQYWRECIDDGAATVRFEIEAWYFAAPDRNAAARTEMLALVAALEGSVLDSAMIREIAYHGFLVELPAPAIARILAGEIPEPLVATFRNFRPSVERAAASSVFSRNAICCCQVSRGAKMARHSMVSSLAGVGRKRRLSAQHVRRRHAGHGQAEQRISNDGHHGASGR